MAEPGTLTDDEIRELAKARVGFKVHAAVYVLVNLFLHAIWALNGGLSGSVQEYWPLWTLLGWGIGLGAHGFGVYGGGVTAVQREEAKLRERLARK